MTIASHLRLYLLTLAIFLVIDLAWLGIVARGFYRDQLGGLLRADVNWGAAFAFYAIYVVGILVFAVLPGLARGEPFRAAALGALLGLVAYAAYDLTNLATLEGFPARLVVVDLVWGAVLTGTVAWLSTTIARAL